MAPDGCKFCDRVGDARESCLRCYVGEPEIPATIDLKTPFGQFMLDAIQQRRANDFENDLRLKGDDTGSMIPAHETAPPSAMAYRGKSIIESEKPAPAEVSLRGSAVATVGEPIYTHAATHCAKCGAEFGYVARDISNICVDCCTLRPIPAWSWKKPKIIAENPNPEPSPPGRARGGDRRLGWPGLA